MSLKLPEDLTHPTKWHAKDPWKDVTHAPGAYPSSPQPENDLELLGQRSLAMAVRERRHEYIKKKQIKVKVGTWNVAAISATHKDLPLWFLKGLGVKGLKQNLSGLSLSDESSGEEDIEPVEHQELRSGRKQSTVPVGEVAAIAGDDDIDLYVLGLQEVIDITSVTEAIKPYYDPNPSKKWKRSIKRNLPSGYQKVAEQQLLGLLILIYAAPQIAADITSVDCQSVGTGALGYMGNKGAVSVRLVLGGVTRMLFVNCHLAAGADSAALSRRIWDTNQILSRTKFSPAILDGEVSTGGPEFIGDEDVAFWFGDLNYRLDDIPPQDVRRLLLLHTRNEYDVLNKSRMRIDSELGYINAPASDSSDPDDVNDADSSSGAPAKDSTVEPELDPKDDPASLLTTINSLMKHDQLHTQQRLRKVFHEGWREGDITFLPTYKYDIGSVGMFDSGEKKRSPSWCDRILYRTRMDRLESERRVEQEAAARKKDEEMKLKGLDQWSAEQEDLFDYDPASDGVSGIDDYDEYDENEEPQDERSIHTENKSEDSIVLKDYVSHQRVLSSDHKPLSAVFDLSYDAVIPELKAKVQQEVAKIMDKNENESRPNVTVVVEDPPGYDSSADTGIGVSELNMVELGDVRYRVPITRTLTVANTGPMPATFAFIDRPIDGGHGKGPFPSWLDIQVHHEKTDSPKEADDLGTSVRFVLSPGDVTTIDIAVNIKTPELVYALNEGAVRLDDVLVLRVLDGRDHFISVKGAWCPTCFYRYLDDLVRFPLGVRSIPVPRLGEDGNRRRESSQTYHSAPKELFELTEALPGLVERTIADWTMTNNDVVAPWNSSSSWPFNGHAERENEGLQGTCLADIREALDTASPVMQAFDVQTPPLTRVELLAETLLSFLGHLQDGIVPYSSWQVIETRLAALDKLKIQPDPYTSIQEIVMDSLCTIPVHSVSLTFIIFTFTRIITELCSSENDTSLQPQTPVSPRERRARSSTEVSEASSEFSIISAASSESASTATTTNTNNTTTTTRSSFLPSFTRRKVGPAASAASSPMTPTAATATPTKLMIPSGSSDITERKSRYIDAYSDVWSGILFRSERDNVVKGKEKKALDVRKKRVLTALLGSPSM